MKQELKQDWIVASVLLAVAFLAYGIMLPSLGLFGDDWPHLWVNHMFGLDGISKLVMWDRPFSAWVYWLIAPLAGDNIWGYHVYLLLIRWVGSVLFYFVVKEIMPDSQPVPFWSAVFFLLYPGFRQQPQPLEFILHFTVLGLLLLSFLCMLRARKTKGHVWLYQIIGAVTSFSIFSIEYFIGLEILRPVFLWIALGSEKLDIKSRLISVGKYWSPYLVVMGGYIYWRVFVFNFPTYKPTFLADLFTNPMNSLIGLSQVLVEEIRASVLGAWRQIITIPLESRAGTVYFLLVAVVFLLIYFWLLKSKNDAGTTSPLIPVTVGGLAILLAGIPFWITGIPVQLTFPWDRSTLPFMLGVSLLLSGGLLFFRPGLRNVLASLIIALSVGMHYQNTQIYQIEWIKLSQFFWQLSWRAPGLKPGTIVISENIPLFYYGDNNLTPVLNWTYAPDKKETNIPYNFFDMGERLGKALPDLKPDLPVEHGYRFVTFKSNSDNLLPVFYTPNHCLRILDSSNAEIPGIPKRLKKVAGFAEPEKLILPEPGNTPPSFIKEPEHGWCFYFQKAELDAQFGNWENVNNLWQEAESKDLQPEDKTELLPIIAAKINTGDLTVAKQISVDVLKQEGTEKVICSLWTKMSAQNLPVSIEIPLVLDSLGCK
jgi:hypothetical protein